jgi:MerR family redox-sensitive transcriptional activator SoxR
MAELLPIGVVAKRSGVAVSALHFYEARGLIRSERSRGNQRRYRRDMLRRIAFIRSGQRVGISLERIAQALAELPDARTPTRADWTRLSRLWRGELEARIAALVRLRDQLDQCIGCGCLSLTSCRLYNPGDVLGEDGSGARRLDPD